MSAWKNLEIDNLPSDILTGGYDFEYCGEDGTFLEAFGCAYEKLKYMIVRGHKYRYRKPEPKATTHEEIMTKWWLVDTEWQKVVGYDFKRKEYFKGEDWNDKQWFNGRESAETPPEEA